MKDLFKEIWEAMVKCYIYYSDFIHMIFPRELGDFIEGILDIAIVCIIIKMIASFAFGTKNNG